MRVLLSLGVSLAILVAIYWKIDFQALVQVFRQCHYGWLAVSLGMVLPLNMLSAVRLQQLVPPTVRLGFAEANRLLLAACSLNMMLPSKMGDLVKAYFIRDQGLMDTSLSLSLVVFEKALDMLSLLLWCGFGLLLYPQKDGVFWTLTSCVIVGLGLGASILGSRWVADRGFAVGKMLLPKRFGGKLENLHRSWQAIHTYVLAGRGQLIKVCGLSIGLWFLHLLQIWFFILALRAWVPLLSNLALAPLAILAGLLPLTFAGVGTRDAAVILFYQPFLNAQTAAALGILFTCRYLLPAIAGLPFLNRYMAAIRRLRRG